MTNELMPETDEPIRQFYWKSKYTALFVIIGFGTVIGCTAIGLYFGSQRQAALDKELLDSTVKHYEDRLGTQSSQYANALLKYDSRFADLATAILEQKNALAAATKQRQAESKKTQALVQQATEQAKQASEKADDLGVKYQQSQRTIETKIDKVASTVGANDASQPVVAKPPKASPTDSHWWNKGH